MKIKAPKDPNKPKRAKSAFMFYCDKHRPKLIEAQKEKWGKGSHWRCFKNTRCELEKVKSVSA